MRLKLLTPVHVLVDEPAASIAAEAPNGHFCLLPRHVDFVALLVPGLLYWKAAPGGERYAAVDEGTLVKRGDEVTVSVLDAILGDSVDELQAAVAETFRRRDEDDRRARSALARLEAATMRRLLRLEERARG